MIDRAPPARGTSLRQVLPDAIFSSGDVAVGSCCTDRRQCRPGDLFVVLPGNGIDELVAEAVERGAAAILTDRPLAGCTVPLCLVDDVREAYGRVCQSLAGYPARRLKIVGITGGQGKTTTSYLTAAVLAAGGWRSGVLGTLGYFDGNEWQTGRWTTPPPAVLAPWLARIAAAGCTHAVMEISGGALARQRVAGVEFDVACITGGGRDHDDRRRRGARPAKVKLLDYLLPEGFAVVNVDDPAAENLLSRLDGPVLTVGVRGAAEITALPLEQFASEQTFLLSAGDESIPVRTPLIGIHNIYNCLAAAAVGLAYSLDLPTIVQGLEVVQRVPGRLERIECGQPFNVFVDDARTPDALRRCLKTLRAVTSGRLICVYGADGDRNKSTCGRMHRAVESVADLAVQIVDDRRETIAWALGQAQPGDCVLIAGKGYERPRTVDDQPCDVDDRQVARQWLYGSLAGEGLYRASA